MRRDGSEFPIEITITRIGEADPPMFTGFIRDITRRKAYEDERERLLELERVARADADQSRGQLAAILSGVADAVTAQAPDGSLLFANDTAVDMLGFDSRWMTCWRRPSPRSPSASSRWTRTGRPFPTERLPGRIALQEGRSAEAVIRFRDPRDGSERWSRVKSTPVLGENGDVAMAINVIEDVTELKRTEQAQRLLAEAGRLLAVLARHRGDPPTDRVTSPPRPGWRTGAGCTWSTPRATSPWPPGPPRATGRARPPAAGEGGAPAARTPQADRASGRDPHRHVRALSRGPSRAPRPGRA